MAFKLELETSNAAFDDGMFGATELARLLADVAGQFERGMFSMGTRVPMRDINGNTVGAWILTVD